MIDVVPWPRTRMEEQRSWIVEAWAARHLQKLHPIALDPGFVHEFARQGIGQAWERLVILDSDVGVVWVVDDSGSPVVVMVGTGTGTGTDREPVEPQRAEELASAVLAQFPQARAIGVEVVGSDPWSVAIGNLDGFTSRATNMHLPLSPPAPPTPVELTPMTPDEFAEFQSWQVEDYVQDLITSGVDEEVARVEGPAQVAALLGEGLNTPDTDLMTARVDGVDIGMIWLNHARGLTFVYDVMVREEFRGRGLGRAVMNAGAARALALGMPGIALNVFASNPTARGLYDSLGYLVTADHRTRDL